VKVRPELDSPRTIKDALFERVVERAGEIGRAAPGHETRLSFQYHASETASIEYVLSRGCAYSESVFRMTCDLSKPLPLIPAPEKIEIRPWRMEGEAEQQAYVRARNEAFPGQPVGLADWQYFLSSPAWQEGGNAITAFDGEEIVGSVAAYWDEAISQQIGTKIGTTEYIFVRANWRRRGIAASLISQALLYLKEHGREIAVLEVSAANRNALDLYQRLGYEVVEETRVYVLRL
jgi:ribosomal protein S18 acetylase RimI-like enzyme